MPNHFLCVCRRRQFCRQPATASRRLFLSTWGSVGSFIASVPGLLPLTTWRRFLLIAFKTNQKKFMEGKILLMRRELTSKVATASKIKAEGLFIGKKSDKATLQKMINTIETDFITDGLNLISYLLDGICPKSDVNSDLVGGLAALTRSSCSSGQLMWPTPLRPPVQHISFTFSAHEG